MLHISYSISPQLQQLLRDAQELRTETAGIPLTNKQRLSLQLHATEETLRYLLSIDFPDMNSEEIRRVIRTHSTGLKKRNSAEKPMQLALKRAQLYKDLYYSLSHAWYASARKVTGQDVMGIFNSMTGLRKHTGQAVDEALSYLQTQHANAIFQAGISLSYFSQNQLFPHANRQTAYFICLIFLFKGGLTVDNTLSLAEQFMLYPGGFYTAYMNAISENNQTLWLEYFASSIVSGLSLTKKRMVLLRRQAGWDDQLETESEGIQIPITISSVSLTKRQQQIMDLLHSAETQLTNRDVQRHCRVSQITASRDMALLRSYGLVIQHGKGRSVYYTKL